VALGSRRKHARPHKVDCPHRPKEKLVSINSLSLATMFLFPLGLMPRSSFGMDVGEALSHDDLSGSRRKGAPTVLYNVSGACPGSIF
jgi:hypothetical protein